jgi:uncharacterized protein YqeY
MLRLSPRRKPGAVPRKAISVLRDQINAGLKEAMKNGEKSRVSTLRMVNAAIKNADIEARGNGKDALADDALLPLLQKMIKQRQESVDLYRKGGREELAQQESEEIAIISSYLPRQMSDDEVGAAIAAVIAETGASGMKDMGRVIAALRERHAGQMDFGKVSPKVKELLSR